MKDSVAYRFSKLASYIYLVLNILGIIGSIVAYYTYVRHPLILATSIIYIFFIFKTLKKLRDNEVQLEIGSEGIYIKDVGLMEWEKMERAVLRSSGTPQVKQTLFIALLAPDRHGKSEYEYDCVPLNEPDSKIRNVLTTYGKEKFLHV